MPVILESCTQRQSRCDAWQALLPLLTALLLGGCDRLFDAGATVKPQARLTVIDGRVLELGRMAGPVLVNFWSTRCAICIEDLPALGELYTRYAPAGVEFIAVAMPSDPPNEVLELATEGQLPFPVALDIDGAVLDAFDRVHGTPTSFLLDASGTVVLRLVGALDGDRLSEAIDGLLDEMRADACLKVAGQCSG